MCGIFGVIRKSAKNYSDKDILKIVASLAKSAQSRGKDSSGLIVRNSYDLSMEIFKSNSPIVDLLAKNQVRKSINKALTLTNNDDIFTVIGHSRLVTNGSQLNHLNNQPVKKGNVWGVHNGIITNDEVLWKSNPELVRKYNIDTEILFALIDNAMAKKSDISSAIATTSNIIEGTYSIALLFETINMMALSTNNGSLYYLIAGDYFIFSSEKFPLKKIAKTFRNSIKFIIKQVMPESCILVSLGDLKTETNLFSDNSAVYKKTQKYSVKEATFDRSKVEKELVLDVGEIASLPNVSIEAKQLEYNIDRIKYLKRCSKCVLPETFPFISFDKNGVCNYCNNYKIKNNPKPIEELEKIIEPYRSRDGSPDCIVPFSGGRDSTAGLHIIKKELGLNPIAYTYDWGMVTDLGRRNIARVCGKLGVENIIVAADIRFKRSNIRKNINAWLKKPHLGMIPLFMAGDKYFYYYVNQVKKQTGIDLNIWGVNPLENTDFKTGFMRVQPDFDKKRIYSLSLKRKAKLISEVIAAFAKNINYINSSLFDSIGSFLSRSVMNQTHYYHLYDYIRWDEKEINELLLNEYGWELAIDTDTTWRIGDGTAAFYNYIYYTVAGFSEHDTFRSNQIREDQISRNEALIFVEKENYPRYPTVKWYLDIVGVDYESSVKRINSIPKLYCY